MRQVRHRLHWGFVTFTAVLLAGVAPALAGYADQVVRYTPGAAGSYTNSAASLNKPADRDSWGTIISPFNGTFDSSQMTGIGAGGELVLHMGAPVPTTGATIGVHAGVGLSDFSWPAGQNFPTAQTYTAPRSAIVSVAQSLENWVDLNNGQPITFSNPTNYYSAGITNPGTATSAGTQEADFFKPFTGQLSDFNGKNWAGTLAVLDGSAGGTWLDLSGTGLSSVNYIRFTVPAGQIDPMYVDAVASVPEPAGLGLLAVAGLLVLRRRARA